MQLLRPNNVTTTIVQADNRVASSSHLNWTEMYSVNRNSIIINEQKLGAQNLRLG